jgi:CheY-like chemotaxis protein
MPGMDGHELLRQLRQSGHHFPAILTSGYEPQAPSDADALEPFRRLPKPFTRQQLGVVLTDIMPQHPSPLAATER